MPVFEYVAFDTGGKLLTGTMEAETRTEVLAVIDQSGWTPISAKLWPAGEARSGRPWRDLLKPEPRPNDITALTLDLAMLLKRGVPLDETLVILTQMENRRWLVSVLRDLHAALRAGKHVLLEKPIAIETASMPSSRADSAAAIST